MSVWMKECGHGCLLTSTNRCCGCADLRPIDAGYQRYVDGAGFQTDTHIDARYKDYCIHCRERLRHLVKGEKRCTCGIVFCDLVSPQCCACLDKRPFREGPYYEYVDGIGMVASASRWTHYCGPCRIRSAPAPENIRTKSRLKTILQGASTAAKKMVDINPYASSQTPMAFTKQNIVNVPTSSGGISVELSATSAEPPSYDDVKGQGVEDPPAYSDVADYEIVHRSESVANEKPYHPNQGVRKWWQFYRER